MGTRARGNGDARTNVAADKSPDSSSTADACIVTAGWSSNDMAGEEQRER